MRCLRKQSFPVLEHLYSCIVHFCTNLLHAYLVRSNFSSPGGLVKEVGGGDGSSVCFPCIDRKSGKRYFLKALEIESNCRLIVELDKKRVEERCRELRTTLITPEASVWLPFWGSSSSFDSTFGRRRAAPSLISPPAGRADPSQCAT